MSIDETKVAFYSNWDIDQLEHEGSVDVSSGTTAVTTIDGVKDWNIQLEISGVRYEPGSNSADANTIFTWYSYVDTNTIYVVTPQAGTVHWHIFKDDLI